MANRTGPIADAARVVRFWHAVEIFSPQAVPTRDAGQHVVDYLPGEPMPWEPGSRFGQEPIRPDQVWRHEIFGGVYQRSRVRDVLVNWFGSDDKDGDQQAPARGHSALFACTLDAEGRPVEESAALSACAWAIGRLLADGETADETTPGTWLAGFAEEALRYACELGKLAGSKVYAGGRLLASGQRPAVDPLGPASDAPPLPTPLDLCPLAGADLQRFTAELAQRLGITGELSPRGVRIRSYKMRANRAESPVQNSFLNSFIADDLDRVATAVLEDGAGAALAAYLTIGRRSDEARRVDVRATPVAAWAGCMPARFPLGRWVSNTDHALAFSQQFAVNEIMHQLASGSGLVAVNGPPGTGKTTMLRDIIAAIVVERALRLTELSTPGEAFSGTRPHKWQAEKVTHTIATPRRSLTGFEMVVASANNNAVENVTTEIPGPEGIGSQWRDRADVLDYFTSTAELTCGEGSWGLIAARLGNAANRRAFSQGFWWGSSQRGDNTAAGMKDVLQVLVGSTADWEAVTLPWGGQHALLRRFRIAEEWAPSRTSVQRLADRTARHGTWLPAVLPDGPGPVWVGTPLRVHRRCDQPIFAISNRIAYDGLMVYGTSPRDPFRGHDVWYDVRSAVASGHWIPAEGQALREVLDNLKRAGVSPGQIRVLSPFRRVVAGAQNVYGTVFPEAARRDRDTWGGTVHTMQGKEADVIILVLGTHPDRSGPRIWAAATPNLLNVAVSRARRRLYVIGNREAWRTLKYFDTLAEALPVWPPDHVRLA